MRIPRGLAVLVLALAFACRQPMKADTSAARLIPREMAVEKLREVLPTAEVLGCTLPKGTFAAADIREWKVDDRGVEFRAAGRDPFRFAHADVTATRLDRLGAYCQVRVYTSAQPDPKKDHFHFNFRFEESARRALELLDALRPERVK